jgi:hypothetical protein
MVFEFDVKEYDFRSILHEMLEIDRSEELHLLHRSDESIAYMDAVKATQFSVKKGPDTVCVFVFVCIYTV